MVWAPSAVDLPWWELAAPLRCALAWAVERPGQILAHAGAVGGAAGGVLLTGRGGSGKSTLAVACLEHGLDYAGDDYVLVTTEPQAVAHAVYRSAKLAPRTLELLPGIAAAAGGALPADDRKVVVDIARHRPERMRASIPITAIVHPRIGGDRAALRNASPRDSLMALAPTTLLQMPGDGAARSPPSPASRAPCRATCSTSDRTWRWPPS